MHKPLRATLLPFFAATFCWTLPTRASTPLSVEVDYATPIDEPATEAGAGGQLRLGHRLDLKIITLDGEVGFGAHALGGTLGPTIYRGVAGARLGLGLALRPSVFAHLGVGHVDFATTPDLTNLTADAGVALDFTLLPVIDLGAHAAYNLIAGNNQSSAFGYATIGGHITFVFD